jgi:hypothetical protein
MRETELASSLYPPAEALFEAGRAVAAFHFGLVLPRVSVTKPQKHRVPHWFRPTASTNGLDSERKVNYGARLLAAYQFVFDVPRVFHSEHTCGGLPYDDALEIVENFRGSTFNRMAEASEDLCVYCRTHPTLVLATLTVAELLQRQSSLARETVNKHIAAALTAPDPFRIRVVTRRLQRPRP